MAVETKKLTGHDVSYIVESILNLEKNGKINLFPVKIGWLISRNKDTLFPKYKELVNMRDSILKDYQDKYFSDDEKSHDEQIPSQDENGENILDEDGNPVMTDGRRINDEFIKEYQDGLKELDNQFIETCNKEDEYFVLTYDMDNFFSDYDDIAFTLQDIEFLKFMAD